MRLAPNVTFEMLDAAFWLDRAPDPDAPLLAPEQIAAFNARVHDVLGIPPVLSLPDTLPRDEVVAQMRAGLPKRVLYNGKGQPVEPAVFESRLEQEMDVLRDPVRVLFGLVERITLMRGFPTAEIFTSRPFDYAFDRMLETTLDVGCPVAIVATGHNEDLFFCLTPLYWGWVFRLNICLKGTRTDIERYAMYEPFIVTTAARGGLVNLITGQPIVTQMGTRLPLSGKTAEVYETQLPSSEPYKPLSVQGYALKTDFAVGYLPLTVRSLFTQAFKMLGEPYAWGGSRFGIFGRDCSRFVQDVYATTGVRLPRNSDQQGRVCCPTAVFTPDMDDETRRVMLVEKVSPGALIELPGHIVLYLGHVEGRPYVIHATSSSGFSEVIVSDLSLGADSPSGSLLRRMAQAVELISG